MTERAVMLVTGAGRGIGAAIATMAGARGYTVVVNYSASAEAAGRVAAGAGNESFAVRADIGSEAQTEAMFEEIDRRCGRIDVLVNNAGIAGSYGPLATYDAATMDRLWAVNITGAFVCAREAAKRMVNGGSIVNISSKAAVLGGAGEWVHYAASKGAIDTMTTGLAKELAAANIRVNAVRPGMIESDFHLHATPGRMERILPVVPMQRAGTPEEVAEAVLWLASPAAAYVTGAFIDVSGGR